MTHTVIGIFDSKEDARDAMNELVQKGFIKEDIDLSNRKKVTGTDNNMTSAGDGISNFFNNLFSDDNTTAQNYSDVARDTEAILTIQTDSKERADQAAEILDSNGAIDVDERAAQYRQNYAQTSGTAQNQTAATTPNQTANTQGEMTIPVVEEQLQVGKRAVETGGVRVRSRVVEKPVEKTLRLREEHVVVDRHPVDRPATEADFNNFKEGDIEITERAEKAVVGKEARVVGEVEVGKTVEEHEKTVSDTLRKTEVDVEKLGTDVDTDVDTNARRANS